MRNKIFTSLSARVTKWSGSSWAFLIALSSIIIWLITGPIFHFSDTWQLVINTGTTIITFLMVFLLQHSQNKDTIAVQMKLDTLIQAIDKADNRLISLEDMNEEQVEQLQKQVKARRKKLKYLKK